MIRCCVMCCSIAMYQFSGKPGLGFMIKRNTFVSGGARGTLPWMAPEFRNGSSTRVDVFSFGIAMWEILTEEEPYADMHSGAIIGKHNP
ncbi:hypothetical protein L1987_38485 [Smallanthus sonchifolius]|uniref:Uncharacterized protein n=1 Tax=Smallanthus sonchifolius TaxID=185202 RepID=A0ACB9HJB6_9ASTR|nr:hypothetical protein L1987_38485 [Smallanthus sonchifolius]